MRTIASRLSPPKRPPWSVDRRDPKPLFRSISNRARRRQALVACVALVAALGLAPQASAADRPDATMPTATPAERAGASDLTLAPELSFTDDSSAAFPIRGRNLARGELAGDRPTAIFFGAAHCWNTNREAERLVQVYRKRGDAVRFLVVDVEHPSPEQRALVKRFYSGSIPTIAVVDAQGNVVYDQAGETAATRGDATALDEIVDQALKSR
jgi:hypothetical protein